MPPALLAIYGAFQYSLELPQTLKGIAWRNNTWQGTVIQRASPVPCRVQAVGKKEPHEPISGLRQGLGAMD